MKKLINKIRRRQSVEESARITTDTIAEHREQILAGGRRFKYPIQYARHRLVFNAILIGVGAILLAILIGWWQLYLVQNTSDFVYRVTKVIPLPVATIDGQPVRYSDYLMKYRSSIHYLQDKEQVNISSADGKRQSDFVKQQAMQDAEADAYAIKLAGEHNISVSDVELQTYLTAQRNSSDGAVSESTYDAVILDYYGWSPDEYSHAMKDKLLRQDVAYAIDDHALNLSTSIGKNIAGGNNDLKSIADSVNSTQGAEVTYAAQGWVPRTNQDGGLAVAAASLKVGQVSSVIKSTSGDGYYYVKLDDINNSQVNYEYIHIPLNAFNQLVANAQTNGKIHEYITVPKITTTKE